MPVDPNIVHRNLVSVIVPCFNYGRFLGQTLESLLRQSCPTWECIIVDDGSTDESAEVAAAYARRDPRFLYLRQENRGQPAARNAGLGLARGDYIQFLDADDLLEPRKLEAHVTFLRQRPAVDIVYSDARYFPSDSPGERRYALRDPDRPWMPYLSGAGDDLIAALLENNILVIHAPLVRREALSVVGRMDESLPRADDWDLWLRCALHGRRFHFLDEPQTLALVRLHSTSLTRRDRRLIASMLHIQRKAALFPLSPALRRRNAEIIGWLERLARLTHLIDDHTDPAHSFILADCDELREELLGYSCMPFSERDGSYWGPPGDGVAAVAELERLRRRGASAIVFAWPAMWYLDHYVELRDHLAGRYRCAARSDDAIIFDLRPAATR